MAPLLEQMRGRLGAYLYGIDVSGLRRRCCTCCTGTAKTFSAAESCTGGLIAKRITDLPGASCVFRGGVVSYTNEVKASVLGVPQETLDRYGAVSEPVARAMAEGVRRITGSDPSVATTGWPAPTATTGKPCGHGVRGPEHLERTVVRHMNCGGGRERVRMLASHCAFDLSQRAGTFTDRRRMNMAKKEPYDMTNNYARMERDKRKAIGNPNKNIHHKKNGSNYQKDTTGSMVRSTSTRQEPEKMSTTMKVLIGVVFGALVAALVAARRPCGRITWWPVHG